VPVTPYLRRLVDERLDALLTELPAVIVVGTRATGKTTTVARRAATVVSLDVPAEAAAFRADPDAALRDLAEPVLLDEWQEVPEVLGAVRRSVNADPSPSRFLVTGSVRAQLTSGVWPATGRLVRLVMYPMTIREQRGEVTGLTLFDRLAAGLELTAPTDPPDLRGYVELALAGGYPQPALRLTGSGRRAWYESYIEDLLTHDVDLVRPTRTRRRDTERLRRYFEACALNSGGTPEHKTLYDTAGIDRITALAYDDLLAGLFVVDRMAAWSTNRLKRLVKIPKRYLIDAALLGAALRLDVDGILRDGNLLGRVLDTLVAAQLRPELVVSLSTPRLYHVRTMGGEREVDLLAELGGGSVVGIEVKASSAPSGDEASGLEWLRDRLRERFVAGVVFHTGPRVYRLGPGIVAAPIASLWEGTRER
jgi:uncharacterized protein